MLRKAFRIWSNSCDCTTHCALAFSLKPVFNSSPTFVSLLWRKCHVLYMFLIPHTSTVPSTWVEFSFSLCLSHLCLCVYVCVYIQWGRRWWDTGSPGELKFRLWLTFFKTSMITHLSWGPLPSTHLGNCLSSQIH